jgi:hypothetical protein
MNQFIKTIISRSHEYKKNTRINYYIGFIFPFAGLGFIIDQIPSVFTNRRCYCITLNLIFIKSYLSFGIANK